MRPIIRYTGSATNINILAIGDGVNYYYGFHIRGICFRSSTRMTAGAALYLNHQRDYCIEDVNFEYLRLSNSSDFPVGLWDALWLDHCDFGYYRNSTISCGNNGITSFQSTGPFFDNLKMIFIGNIAIYFGGGCCGIYTGYIEIDDAGTGIQIDTALNGVANCQFFFSQFTVVDECRNNAFYLNDAIGGFLDCEMMGWAASSHNGANGFVINNWKNGVVSFTGARLVNNSGNGLFINDASCRVMLDSTCNITLNSVFGINGIATSNLFCDAFPAGNYGPDFGVNYGAGTGCYNAAWSSL